MVNVAYRLRADIQPHDSNYSVLDLKADWRGYRYVEETLKLLPEKPEAVLLAKIRHQVAGLGRIHASQPCFSFS
jgi:putative transposase